MRKSKASQGDEEQSTILDRIVRESPPWEEKATGQSLEWHEWGNHVKVLEDEPSGHMGATAELGTSWGPTQPEERARERLGEKVWGRQCLDQVGTLGKKEFGFCSVRRDAFGRGMTCMIWFMGWIWLLWGDQIAVRVETGDWLGVIVLFLWQMTGAWTRGQLWRGKEVEK